MDVVVLIKDGGSVVHLIRFCVAMLMMGDGFWQVVFLILCVISDALSIVSEDCVTRLICNDCCVR